MIIGGILEIQKHIFLAHLIQIKNQKLLLIETIRIDTMIQEVLLRGGTFMANLY